MTLLKSCLKTRLFAVSYSYSNSNWPVTHQTLLGSLVVTFAMWWHHISCRIITTFLNEVSCYDDDASSVCLSGVAASATKMARSSPDLTQWFVFRYAVRPHPDCAWGQGQRALWWWNELHHHWRCVYHCIIIRGCIRYFERWGVLLMVACCSGFISSLVMFTQQRAGADVAGVIMIVIGVMFAACAFLDMIMLIKVRTIGSSY